MQADLSEGWDAVAGAFMAARSGIGAGLVRGWAGKSLPPGADILDVGCGSGVPIAEGLIADGFAVWGVDASPRLVAAFEARFPGVPVACEAAQESAFFARAFDGVIAVGLVFLLAEEDQRRVIARMAAALKPGGRLLFSAPLERCEWKDSLTGRRSVSLGRAAYGELLAAAGLSLCGTRSDEGGNSYFEAVKPGPLAAA